MRKAWLVTSLIVFFGVTASASAGVIPVSLQIGNWVKTNLTFGGIDYQGPATVANSAEGYLVGTKTTPTGGTNYSLGLHTVDAYDLRDATLRYEWLLNGQGNYSGIYTGVDTGDGHSHLINNFDPNAPIFAPMTTAWSFNGSEVIPSNIWLWTEITFSSTGYDFTVSKTGYGGNDFLHGTKTIGTTTWASLAAAHPFFQLGDNYAAGAYFKVADLSITTRDQPVPEPTALALIGIGLAGLAAVRRGKEVSA